MMRSLYGKIKGVYGIAKTVGSGDFTTPWIDLQGFKSCAININAGIFALTSTNKMSIKVYESDDATTIGTVADADMEGMEGTGAVFRELDLSASDAQTTTTLFYKGVKRYVQVKGIEGGTVALPLSVAFILGDSDSKPSVD